ncbi:MAG TPA: hypothetical protein VIY30_18130 [Burkholderiaceae bacterium]
MRLVIDALEQLGERIRFEAFAVQQIVLKELAWVVGLGVGLSRQRRVRALSQPFQPFAQRVGQVSNIAAMLDGLAVCPGVRVRMAWRWRLI